MNADPNEATLAEQLERLRTIGAEQTTRRARRAALEAELQQLRDDGNAAHFEAAPLLTLLAHPSRDAELETLRHATGYPL